MDEVAYMVIEGVSIFEGFPKAKCSTLVENHHVRCVVINSVVHNSRGSDLTAVKSAPPRPALTDRLPAGFLDRTVHGVVRYG
ncbi:MAG: hypothetical protein L7G99_02845 [Vulcanisaeta sp.]|nr:hypothetical protein [Vulcanisaeta sp.]